MYCAFLGKSQKGMLAVCFDCSANLACSSWIIWTLLCVEHFILPCFTHLPAHSVTHAEGYRIRLKVLQIHLLIGHLFPHGWWVSQTHQNCPKLFGMSKTELSLSIVSEPVPLLVFPISIIGPPSPRTQNRHHCSRKPPSSDLCWIYSTFHLPIT